MEINTNEVVYSELDSQKVLVPVAGHEAPGIAAFNPRDFVIEGSSVSIRNALRKYSLQLITVLGTDTEPDIGNEYSIVRPSFSREPIIEEYFSFILKYTNKTEEKKISDTYVCVARVMSKTEGNPDVYTIEIVDLVSIKGEIGTSVVNVTSGTPTLGTDKQIKFPIIFTLSDNTTRKIYLPMKIEQGGHTEQGEYTETKVTLYPYYGEYDKFGYIVSIYAKNGKDGENALPLVFADGTYYDPEHIEDYEKNGISIYDLTPITFDESEEGYAYLVDDWEVKRQYDLYIHTFGATKWIIVDNWGGVPGQPGRGISSVVSTKHTSENGETVTYADIHYTDGTVEQDALEIHAQNGADGVRGPQGYTPLYCKYIVQVTNPAVGGEVSVLSNQLGGDLLTSSVMNCLLVNIAEGVVYTAILKWKRGEGDNEIFTIQEFYDISGNPGANALYFKSFTMSSSSKPGNSVWSIPDNWKLYFNRKPLLNDVYLQLIKVTGTNDVYLVPQFVEMYNGKLSARGYSNKTYKLNGDIGLNGYSCWYYEDTVGQHDAGDVVMLSWTFIKPSAWDHNLTAGEAVITKDGYLLTLVNNVDSNVMDDFEAEVVAKLGGGGSFIEITSPTTATDGTLTDEQFNFLQESVDNYIVFAKEIYKLQDNQHDPGYLIYTHVGHNSSNNFTVKCITITVSTKAWVLTTEKVGSGYDLTITDANELTSFITVCNNNSLVQTYGKSIRTVLIKNVYSSLTIYGIFKVPKEVTLINCRDHLVMNFIGTFNSGCICSWDFDYDEETESDLVIKNMTLNINGNGIGFCSIAGGLENCKVIHFNASTGAVTAYQECKNLTNCYYEAYVSTNFLSLETGFKTCNNLINCSVKYSGTGYNGCSKLYNCKYDTNTVEGAALKAFVGCSDMVSSYANIIQSTGNLNTRGLFNCNRIVNCEIKCGGVFATAANTGYIYYACQYLNNCRFSGPSMPAHLTYAWSGNNTKRDDSTCLISLSDV